MRIEGDDERRMVRALQLPVRRDRRGSICQPSSAALSAAHALPSLCLIACAGSLVGRRNSSTPNSTQQVEVSDPIDRLMHSSSSSVRAAVRPSASTSASALLHQRVPPHASYTMNMRAALSHSGGLVSEECTKSDGHGELATTTSRPPPFFGCSTRRVRLALCVLLNILAACVLVPGLSLPLLTVVVRVGRTELLRQTRSTLGTIQFLHAEGAHLPAALILIFSVFVPVLKFVVLILIACWPDLRWRRHLYLFVRNWSKWSMADVFVTAVFVAFLSANAAPATMAAQVEPGFYWFLSYCALSLLALQLMPRPAPHRWQQDGGDETELAAETFASAPEVDGDPYDDDLNLLERMEEQRDQKDQSTACTSPREGDEWRRLNDGAQAQQAGEVGLHVAAPSVPSLHPVQPATPSYSMLRSGAGRAATPQQQLQP